MLGLPLLLLPKSCFPSFMAIAPSSLAWPGPLTPLGRMQA